MRWALILAALVAAAAAGAAERIELAAVGVLGRGERATCTGLLIEPDLVLTAAHCVAGQTRGGPDLAEGLFFRTPAVAGVQETRAARDVMVHTLWQPGNSNRPSALRHDLALVVLAEPIVTVPPLAIGAPPAAGEAFIVAGYPGAKGEIARERRCPSVALRGDVVALACVVRTGESGSAVLRKVGDRIEVAAVIAATSTGEGQRLALAGAAGPRVRQLKALLGRPLDGAGVRRGGKAEQAADVVRSDEEAGAHRGGAGVP